MRCLLLVLLFVSCVVSVAVAGGLSDIEKGIIRLEYIGRQVQAIENELRLYYMAKIEDRPNAEPTENIERLEGLNKELDALNLPQELEDLKQGLASVINKLIDNCTGILNKNAEKRDKEFDEFWKLVNTYNDQLEIKIGKYFSIPKIDENFDLVGENVKLLTDINDQNLFRKALSYMDKKQHKAAVDILNPLLKKYKNKPAEGSILVDIADCYIAKENPAYKDADKQDELLNLLTDYINRKQYSPSIQRIYLQWRTLEQSYNHGASNWSVIPNDEYNQTLWGLIETIESHIDRYPDDSWAKFQLLLLMNTPIIERWGRGYPYGNTMALDYAFLNGTFENK